LRRLLAILLFPWVDRHYRKLRTGETTLPEGGVEDRSDYPHRFHLEDVLWGVNSVALYYTNQLGTQYGRVHGAISGWKGGTRSPASCSESTRNPVRLHPGIAFALPGFRRAATM
jgi:hypothetical protein